MTLQPSEAEQIRILFYIPIIHTHADMGAMGEVIQQAALKKYGAAGWGKKVKTIDRLWTEIERTVKSLRLDNARVRVYQDGLPECGREMEIVSNLAEAGSRNHRLLLRLAESGAEIMGTESAELLVEEYQLVKQTLASGCPAGPARAESRQKALSLSLLKRRDQYIARRINTTLLKGETGILFLGMLHSLKNLLDRDIRVIYPITLNPSHGERIDGRIKRSNPHCG